MSFVLYIVGVVFSILGIVALGFGIPIKEFSFGNTMIVAGAIGLAAGATVIGLAAVVRELRRIGGRLAQAPAAQLDAAAPLVAAPQRPSPPPYLQPQAPQSAERIAARDDHAQAERPVVERPNAERILPERPPSERPARDSVVPQRPVADRKPAAPREAALPPFRAEPHLRGDDHDEPGDDAYDDYQHDDEPDHAAEDVRVSDTLPRYLDERDLRASAEARQQRAAQRSQAATPVKQSAAERLGFPTRRSETARAEARQRAAEIPTRAEPVRREHPADEGAPLNNGSDFDRLWPEEQPPHATPDTRPVPPAEPPVPIQILRSGVVEGMAYTLYSDGSIEAQLPEGHVRFASIEDLRAHLDQRG